MQQIGLHEANTQFLTLIAAVEKGEEIIIARYGEPVAKIVPFRKSLHPRQPGSAKGKFTVSPDFFKPLPDDILDAFAP